MSALQALIPAAVALCDQEERRAHAEFFFDTGAENRRFLAKEGSRPWRGLMNPRILDVIHVLEESGAYEGPGLAIPKALAV